MFNQTTEFHHKPVDSTKGSKALRFVFRLRTETTAALPENNSKLPLNKETVVFIH